MTTENMQRELDAAFEILKLHQANFAAMETVMNAQAKHIMALEQKVATLEALLVTVYPKNEEKP